MTTDSARQRPPKLGISESVVMRMSGHRTRAVFERDNIVDEKDLREAVRVLEKLGRVLDTVAVSGLHKRKSPGTAAFANPSTGAPWQDIRKAFRRAVVASELEGLWFHDLRSSFVTRARKLGISESVVIRMSGHPTRAVFGRYNIVDERDLREAVRVLEKFGRVLDIVDVSGLHKRQSPTA